MPNLTVKDKLAIQDLRDIGRALQLAENDNNWPLVTELEDRFQKLQSELFDARL
jgi:hypothetical protein